MSNTNEPTDGNPPPSAPEQPGAAPIQPAGWLSRAAETTAEELVGRDRDKFPSSGPPPEESGGEAGEGEPNKGGSKAGVKRGKYRKNRNPPPDMSDLPPRDGAKQEGAPGAAAAAAAPPPPPKPQVDYKILAETIFGLATGVAAKAIGPEWAPQNEVEKNSVTLPLEAYLRTKQIPDMPPGVMLCLSVAFYCSARFTQPNTREKVKGFFGWIRMKFGRKRKGPIKVVENDNSRERQAA